MNEESLKMARHSLLIESQAISDIQGYLDEHAFARAVDSLTSANRIATTGCGNAGIAAMKFAHSLCCVEQSAKFIPPGEAPHGGLGFVQEGDTMVMASRGGRTAELIPIVSVCKKKKSTVILITENEDSPLARSSDILLKLKIERESDRFNVMATASFMATVAIFDALQVAIMEGTQFGLDEFALIHPGGAVGERLNS